MKETILIVEDEFVVAHDLQRVLEKANYHVCGISASVKQALEVLDTHHIDLVLLDIYLKGRLTGIDLATMLTQRNVPFIYISANSNEKVFEAAKATQPYGFIVKPYKPGDVLLSIDIARYRYIHSIDLKSSGELYLQSVIENITAGNVNWQQKLLQTVSALQPYVPFDFVAIAGLDAAGSKFTDISFSRTAFNEYQAISFADFMKLAGLTPATFKTMNAVTPEMTTDNIYSGNDFEAIIKKHPQKAVVAQTFSLKSNLVKSILLDTGQKLIFSFYSRIPDIYKIDHIKLLTHLQSTLKNNLHNTLDKAHLKNNTDLNKAVTVAEKAPAFSGIIGTSSQLLKVLDQVKIVAPTDTSVLIMGESGTGKEMIAYNLHKLSHRSSRPMVTVNCAALPAELIESILFGHEKGSFTGATERRKGKFEEADGGTIFLDEIGEMPFELQPKLLRVLQEKEIERIGGAAPIPVNLRIIAATNRNLEKEITLGKFRLDLYYRLNVFPINLPPLRDRRDDIPLLANYFTAFYAKKLRKTIKGIARPVMNALTAFDWPGNVRELEHLIERSVLLCETGIIEENYLEAVPKSVRQPVNQDQDGSIKTIAENERDYIISVLQKCNGKISGEGGAATLLGIPATTLNSKIKKLDIKRYL